MKRKKKIIDVVQAPVTVYMYKKNKYTFHPLMITRRSLVSNNSPNMRNSSLPQLYNLILYLPRYLSTACFKRNYTGRCEGGFETRLYGGIPGQCRQGKGNSYEKDKDVGTEWVGNKGSKTTPGWIRGCGLVLRIPSSNRGIERKCGSPRQPRRTDLKLHRRPSRQSNSTLGIYIYIRLNFYTYERERDSPRGAESRIRIVGNSEGRQSEGSTMTQQINPRPYLVWDVDRWMWLYRRSSLYSIYLI